MNIIKFKLFNIRTTRLKTSLIILGETRLIIENILKNVIVIT